MKTYTCMIEGAFGRASRETKKIQARDLKDAWTRAQRWCASRGEEFDIIELTEVAE